MAELDSALAELRATARERRAEQETSKLNQSRNTRQSQAEVSCAQPQALDAAHVEITARATSSAGEKNPIASRVSQLWRAMIRRIRH